MDAKRWNACPNFHAPAPCSPVRPPASSSIINVSLLKCIEYMEGREAYGGVWWAGGHKGREELGKRQVWGGHGEESRYGIRGRVV